MRLLAALLLLAPAAALAQGATTPVFDAVSAGNLPLNVKGAPYNAKCDGTTDDTAAIQNAINAGVASGKSFTLLLPAGVCKTTATLTITGASGQNVGIKGETRATSQLLVTGTGDGIDISMTQAGTVFGAMLDISDFTMLATGNAGTAIKATSNAPNSVSPKFHNLRIGYLGSGAFANGISLAHMSNIFVRAVNINSPNATGYAFAFDGDSTFPSITDNFSDIYFWGFATGIQIGDGVSKSYVQGVEITNAQLQQNNKSCVTWNNSANGFLGDMFLMNNSFCNGTMLINFVEDISIQGNYFLSGGGSSGGPILTVVTATSGVVSNNVFNGDSTVSNLTGILISNSHVIVSGNYFIDFGGASGQPIIFNTGSASNLAIGNRCDLCTNPNLVADFGNNWQMANINSAGGLGTTIDNIPSKVTAERILDWHVPASPTLSVEGTVIGWNYAGQGEADIFLSRGAGGPGGFSELWYDTTSGSVGTQLMGLDVSGNLHLAGALVNLAGAPVAVSGGLQFTSLTTVASLPACSTTLKGTLRTVTDATAPAYNVALAGSGAVVVPAFCNGTAWVAH